MRIVADAQATQRERYRRTSFRHAQILGLICTAAIFLVAAKNAASETSGGIVLHGVVPPQCLFTIQDQAVSLDLTQALAGVAIAVVTEQCNVPAGYIMTLASANGGVLQNAHHAAGVPFTLQYSGVAGPGSFATARDRPEVERTETLTLSLAAPSPCRQGLTRTRSPSS